MVQNRLQGDDSQDLSPDDLLSIFDRPAHDKEKEENNLFVKPTARPPQSEELKRELEEINKPHEKDLMKKRKLEEDCSQELVQSLQVLFLNNNSSDIN